MHEVKKNGKVFTSEFVGTGPSSYEKRIYRAAVSQSLRNTALVYHDLVHTASYIVKDTAQPYHICVTTYNGY